MRISRVSFRTVFLYFSSLLREIIIFAILYSLPGLKERLNREIMQIRPFQSAYNVVIAQNVHLNAWHGAKDFANSSDFESYLTTKSDYAECGGEYLKEHFASNKYFPTPVAMDELSQTSVEADNTNIIDNSDSPSIKMEEEIDL